MRAFSLSFWNFHARLICSLPPFAKRGGHKREFLNLFELRTFPVSISFSKSFISKAKSKFSQNLLDTVQRNTEKIQRKYLAAKYTEKYKHREIQAESKLAEMRAAQNFACARQRPGRNGHQRGEKSPRKHRLSADCANRGH